MHFDKEIKLRYSKKAEIYSRLLKRKSISVRWCNTRILLRNELSVPSIPWE